MMGEEVGDGVFIEGEGPSIDGPREVPVHRGLLREIMSYL
jgi:hypothetical protein